LYCLLQGLLGQIRAQCALSAHTIGQDGEVQQSHAIYGSTQSQR
jgi:hypothetical protein